MDMAVAGLALVGAVLLGLLWVVHVRRDTQRRAARSAEWDVDAPGGTDLWTSAARCLRCGASGALLRREDGQLWHTCMACGHRHVRQNQD